MLNIENSILKKYWGYDSFLPNQKEIINSILDSKDTIALIPTGGGKSMCYQIPALILEGTCIVISPLIALINDQILRLNSLNIKAEGLHSGLDKVKQREIETRLIKGDLDLIYISPEKLQSKRYRDLIKDIQISFVAIDEAHCISQWGYDFRPEYLEIANIKELFPAIPFAAFTATANSKTLSDIKKYLALTKPKVIRGSFLKNNITFGVIETEKKLKIVYKLLKEFEGSGIIYMRSRKGTEALTDLLKKQGESVSFYHAGMDNESRENVQKSWLINEIRLIVSTTAFGMGIDKPDVRFVLHFDLPTSIEEYYQEAGRAGRDGNKSNAIIIYNKNDIKVLQKNNIDSFPSKKEIELTYQNLLSFLKIEVIPKEGIIKNIDLVGFLKYNTINNFKSYNCINELQRSGALELNIPIRDRFSQLKIECDVIELEKISELDINAYEILKSSILIYEGLFLSMTNISEKRIAEKSGFSIEEVISVFEKYSDNKLITYKRQKLDFSIVFKGASNLVIDKSTLLFRFERLKNSIKSISDYLGFEKCRQKFILKYFDEKLKKNCGLCDICSNVDEINYTKAEFSFFKDIIDKYNFDKNTDIDDLVYVDTFLNRNKNIHMLKEFFKKGELLAIGDKIIRLSR